MEKIILINKDNWQTRVAVVQGEKLVDLQFEDNESDNVCKAFYKGKIEKVLPGIQTAFVDIGRPRAGYLHITEIDPAKILEKNIDKKVSNKKAVPMDKIFSVKENVLVQIKREAIHGKGAKITTCYALPGKYLVLMPNSSQIGISSRIEDQDERLRLKNMISKNLPESMGAIVRTSAQEKSEKEINRDINYLKSTWQTIIKNYESANPGDLVYQDLPLAVRVIRETLDESVDKVYCNDMKDFREIEKFLKSFMPELLDKLELYQDKDLFYDFKIDEQINQLFAKKVNLKSGGSIIIESTESMTVVDVNTGSFVGKKNMDETVLTTNLEAATEVVNQLNLRKIGGIIVIDFIDMHKLEHRETLFEYLQEILRTQDRQRSVTLNVSEFGLVQIARQKPGKTLIEKLGSICQTCSGTGYCKSVNTYAFEVLRNLKRKIILENLQFKKLNLFVSPGVFKYLSDNAADHLIWFEKNYNTSIILSCKETLEKSESKVKIH